MTASDANAAVTNVPRLVRGSAAKARAVALTASAVLEKRAAREGSVDVIETPLLSGNRASQAASAARRSSNETCGISEGLDVVGAGQVTRADRNQYGLRRTSTCRC